MNPSGYDCWGAQRLAAQLFDQAMLRSTAAPLQAVFKCEQTITFCDGSLNDQLNDHMPSCTALLPPCRQDCERGDHHRPQGDRRDLPHHHPGAHLLAAALLYACMSLPHRTMRRLYLLQGSCVLQPGGAAGERGLTAWSPGACPRPAGRLCASACKPAAPLCPPSVQLANLTCRFCSLSLLPPRRPTRRFPLLRVSRTA